MSEKLIKQEMNLDHKLKLNTMSIQIPDIKHNGTRSVVTSSLLSPITELKNQD